MNPAVIHASGDLGRIVTTLDSWGFDVANHRISVYRAIVTVLVLLAVFVFARLGSKLAKQVFCRVDRLDAAQQLLAEKLVSIGVWAFALLVGIDVLGIDLTALAVFSGAFGLAIGFGLQKTFGNLIAGIILLMDRSIKPGDVIAVNDGSGTVGQVKKIGIRAVSITTRDKKEYLIPNENLMINQVENWSYSSRDVRVKIPIGVAYGTDIDLAEKILVEAAKSSPRVKEVPPPTVWLSEIGESAINFEIQAWIDDPEDGLGNLRSDVLKRVWRAFREAGIEVPFAQRDLNLRDNKVLRELIAAIRGDRIADAPKPESLSETMAKPKAQEEAESGSPG